MFIFSVQHFRFYFSGILIAVSVIASLLLILSRPPRADVDAAALQTENEIGLCRSFLTARGWKTAPAPPEVTDITVPETFSEVYEAYNALQKAQGYDLSPYRGKQIRKIVFVIAEYPLRPQDDSVRAAVLLKDGVIIGGDIFSVRSHGFMHGFSFETIDYAFYPT